MSGVPQAQQSAESITRVREHMIQIGLQFVRPQLSVFTSLLSARLAAFLASFLGTRKAPSSPRRASCARVSHSQLQYLESLSNFTCVKRISKSNLTYVRACAVDVQCHGVAWVPCASTCHVGVATKTFVSVSAPIGDRHISLICSMVRSPPPRAFLKRDFTSARSYLHPQIMGGGVYKFISPQVDAVESTKHTRDGWHGFSPSAVPNVTTSQTVPMPSAQRSHSVC